MTSNRNVTVYGAYGHTGRFVVAELLARGWTPILSGRDADKLNALDRRLDVRPASVDDASSLDRAFAGSAAVIHCAGPFADTSAAVVEAALRAEIPYLDPTAEGLVAMNTFEHYAARAGGVVILPAMGFYGGLGDLLATVAMDNDDAPADEVRVGFALDGWHPTRGTRITGQRTAGRRVFYSNNRLEVGSDPQEKTTWNFPAPVGAQEVVPLSTVDIVTMSRHLRAREIRTFMNLAPIADLRNPETPAPVAADERGRSSQSFLVEAVVRRGGKERRAVARGRDIYAVSAPILVEAMERVLDGRTRAGHASGVVAAGAIFDAEDFLRALSPKHLEYEVA
ncbi:NAD(P)H-binding protein [Pendulispora brunnea]|uniref:NAD(P)H-binding protein n=1 Tax=Pendulispora brunnea TaxID=2905690 RepID=A0ABZ2KJQ8_9BACT